MSLSAWLRAVRPLAHANIAPPLVLGQALAFVQGHGFDPAMAALAHGFGAIDHVVIVLTNDLADRDADALNTAPTPFSGGSRVLQRGLLTPAQLTRAALAASSLLVALGVGAIFVGRPWILPAVLAALALLAAYSLPPLRLSYRGYGEVCQGLGVGLVLPLVGYYAQSGSLSETPWSALAPLVLLGFVSNILTALPDTPADRAAGKATWPVRRGEAAARRDALVLLGVGLLLAAQLSPPLSPSATLLAFVPPAALALIALRYLRRADAAHRDECLRFVVLAAGATTLAQLGWAYTLFVA